MISALPVLDLRGTHGEMGIHYGKEMKDLIELNLEDYLRRFRDVSGLADSEVRGWGQTYRTVVQRYDLRIAEMLDGLSEGADLDPAHIFALNARTEILQGSENREEACTSVAVLPTVTKSEGTLIGQNWDWHPEQSDMMIVLITSDSDGFVIVTLAEAGMLAKSGLNSAGLGLCANLLVSDRDKGGEGVPYHILLRGVLEAKTMADATSAAVVHPRVSSGNFLIADSEGEAIDLEVVPEDFGYLLPENGIIVHSNHFLTNVPVYDRRKAFSALTLLRPARAKHLLADKVADHSVEEQDVKKVFRDHYSYPNGICRHVDNRDGHYDRVHSAFSVTMDLNSRQFSIAKGPPCEHEYESFYLGDSWSEQDYKKQTRLHQR